MFQKIIPIWTKTTEVSVLNVSVSLSRVWWVFTQLEWTEQRELHTQRYPTIHTKTADYNIIQMRTTMFVLMNVCENSSICDHRNETKRNEMTMITYKQKWSTNISLRFVCKLNVIYLLQVDCWLGAMRHIYSKKHDFILTVESKSKATRAKYPFIPFSLMLKWIYIMVHLTNCSR